jgi:hypothetical protein
VLARTHESKLPSPRELAELRLNVRRVAPIDLAKVLACLAPSFRHRFKKLMSLVSEPRYQASSVVQQSYAAPAHRVDELVACDICEPVTESMMRQSPTRGSGVMFFVVQMKESETVLRCIFWPKRHNDWLDTCYECEVPLAHISQYLGAVRNECGVTGDFTSGFFQVEIPAAARCNFRFVDAAGRLMQMCRLPMGLSVSVEIMQLVTEAMIGSERVCVPAKAIRGVTSAAWVDDFQIVGARDRVANAARLIQARIDDAGGTLKAPLELRTKYVFIGVEFDHTTESVAVAQKTLAKLPKHIPERMALRDVEALVSRLNWCDAVLHVPLSKHQFAFKWAVRQCNAMNRGRKRPEEVVPVPNTIRTELIQWRRQAEQSQRITRRIDAHLRLRGRAAATMSEDDFAVVLYTDASLQGAGAVFEDRRTFRRAVIGKPWSDGVNYQSGDMGFLEGKAVEFAVDTFWDELAAARNVLIYVDNTSVHAALQSTSGNTKANSLHRALAPTLERMWQQGIAYVARYIHTSENIADAPSRGLPLR